MIIKDSPWESLLLRLFGLKPKSKRRIEPSGVHHTIVPLQYEEMFPEWDKKLYENITYV